MCDYLENILFLLFSLVAIVVHYVECTWNVCFIYLFPYFFLLKHNFYVDPLGDSLKNTHHMKGNSSRIIKPHCGFCSEKKMLPSQNPFNHKPCQHRDGENVYWKSENITHFHLKISCRANQLVKRMAQWKKKETVSSSTLYYMKHY